MVKTARTQQESNHETHHRNDIAALNGRMHTSYILNPTWRVEELCMELCCRHVSINTPIRILARGLTINLLMAYFLILSPPTLQVES